MGRLASTIFLNRTEPTGRDDLLSLCEVGFTGTAGRHLRMARTQRSPVPRAHRPDLLAVDESRRLMLIDVAVSQDDTLLVRALAHHAAVVQDFAEVAVLFDEPRPDASRVPGIILVVPEVAPLLQQAAAAAALPVEFFRYRLYSTHLSRGFALEAVEIGGERSAIEPFRTGLGTPSADLSDAEVLEVLLGAEAQ
jgi:hypothetical protein